MSEGLLIDTWTKTGELVYRGHINDLRDALRAVLSNNKVLNPRTPAIGCNIPDPSPGNAK